MEQKPGCLEFRGADEIRSEAGELREVDVNLCF